MNKIYLLYFEDNPFFYIGYSSNYKKRLNKWHHAVKRAIKRTGKCKIFPRYEILKSFKHRRDAKSYEAWLIENNISNYFCLNRKRETRKLFSKKHK